MYRFHQKNLLLLTGGKLDGDLVEEMKRMSGEILSKDEMGLVEEKLFRPLMSSIPKGASPYSSFTILEREDTKHAVILRYGSKEDYIGTNPDIPEREEDDDEFTPDVCIRSEFLGARRLMIVLS
jgi:hypothetical protein